MLAKLVVTNMTARARTPSAAERLDSDRSTPSRRRTRSVSEPPVLPIAIAGTCSFAIVTNAFA